jgi:hypothetical protein
MRLQIMMIAMFAVLVALYVIGFLMPLGRIADKVRESNPVPPAVEAHRRELSAISLEFNTASTEQKSSMLRSIAEKFPTAKADTIAWSQDQDLILESEAEFEIDPQPAALAWAKDECTIGCENLSVLIDAGIFSE